MFNILAMFNTKCEVDKHVKHLLRNITSKKESQDKSYLFAKLYFDIEDYGLSKRYVISYLSSNPKSPEGHHLLGCTLEILNKRDAALVAYKTSLRLDPKQLNLVLKVCELLNKEDMDFDVEEGEYFCKMAENIDPHSPHVCNLKEKLTMKKQTNPQEVINMLQKELDNYPTNINLRISLLRNFVQNNRISEAYKHINDIKMKNILKFSNNAKWFEVIEDIFTRYKNQALGTLTWQFWFTFISILDKVLGLMLDENSDNVKETSHYINKLFLLDQSLFEAYHKIIDCSYKLLLSEFFNHYRGQLCFHYATTILKQAKNDLIKINDVEAVILPLLFAAYNLKPVDLRASWIKHLQKNQKEFLEIWNLEGSFRCSQSGHILLAAAQNRKYGVVEKASQYSFGTWQERLFKNIFVNCEQQSKMESSFFVNNQIEVDMLLPKAEDLLQFDRESLYLFPDSLHHYIWVFLNNDSEELLRFSPFEALKYSVKNLSNCEVKTLSLLDIEAFMYCATFCTKVHHNDRIFRYGMDGTKVLPVCITEHLGSVEQEKFFTAAHEISAKEQRSDLADMALILNRGLETIRCIEGHGIGARLLVELADFFSKKAKKTNKRSEIDFNNARAELYWKSALMLLEKLKTNQSVTYPANSLFQYETEELSCSEIGKQIYKGKYFLCTLALQQKQYEKALSILEELEGPYARFRQAEIYKQMAVEYFRQNEDNEMKELRIHVFDLINKARNCLNSALHLLTDQSADNYPPWNRRLTTKIHALKNFLVEFESDYICISERELMSENASSDNGEEYYSFARNDNQCRNNSTLQSHSKSDIWSTPLHSSRSKRKMKPTPKGLDAQIKLCAAKDIATSKVLEQNKFMLQSHRSLVEELRGFKDVVHGLSAQVSELKTAEYSLEEVKDLRKSVDLLKNSVKDVKDLRNVSDLVCELRLEIEELKKDDAQSRRGNVKYVRYTPNSYQRYANMIHQVPPPYANLYPHGFHPALYGATVPFGYPNMGLSQLGSPYGSEQTNIKALLNPSTQANPLFYTQSQVAPKFVPVPLEPPLNSASSSWNAALLTGQSISQSTWQSGGATASSFPLTSSTSAPMTVIKSSDPTLILQSSFSQPLCFGRIPPRHTKEINSQLEDFQIDFSTGTVPNGSAFLKPTEALKEAMSNKPQKFSNLLEENVSTASRLISLGEFPSNISSSEVTLELEPEASLDSETRNIFANFAAGNKFDKALEKNETVVTNLREGSSSMEEFEPSSELQPAVSLPDLIEVKTAEKDADILFDCRAKLFRLDDENMEWKERGLGNMKILREKSLVRLLMRCEKILEIFVNHRLLKNMNFRYMPANSTALTWCAQNIADDVSKTETFAIKLKTEKQAGEFLKCISSAQAAMNDDNVLSAPRKENASSELHRGFGDTFIVSKGTSECLVSNENNLNKCSARETPKASIQNVDQVSLPNKKDPFVLADWEIGPTRTREISSKEKVGTWECKCCFLKNEPVVMFCSSCKFPKNIAAGKEEASKGLSGIGSGPTTREAVCALELGSSSRNLTAGCPNTDTTFDVQSPSLLEPGHQSDVFQKISETFLINSPASLRCEVTAGSDMNTSENENDEFDWNDLEFTENYLKRVLQNKEAERNQEVSYCRKATLFKLVNGKWTERGFGELMILRAEQQNGDLRVLMRTDRSLKICLNHALTFAVEYLSKDYRTWLFSAADSSEGEERYGQFCLSFENAAFAEEFMAVVTELLKKPKAKKQSIDSENGSEVEFTEETSVTTEDLNEAQRMNLPPKFFAYKQLPLCSCDQCARDDDYFKDTVLDERLSRDATILTTPRKQSDYSNSSESDVFLTPSSFSEVPTYETLRDPLAKPPIIAQNTTTPASNEKRTFWHSNTEIPISSSTTTAGNLFGSKFSGGKSLFSTKAAPTDNKFTAKYPEICVVSPSTSFLENKRSETDAKQKTKLFQSSSTDHKISFCATPSTQLFGISTPTSTSISLKFLPSKAETGVFDSSKSTVSSLAAKPIFGSNTSTIFELNRVKSSTEGIIPKAEALGSFNINEKLFGNSKDYSLSTKGAKFQFGMCVTPLPKPGKEIQTTETHVSSSTGTTGTKTSELEENDEVILNCNSGLSFASLAQKNPTATFQRTAEGGGDFRPFSFLGAGAPVFGSKEKQESDPTSDHLREEDNRETSIDEEYDPHYEPIIPLPDVIDVSTGEEEETAVFNERAKLYRYDPDSIEWKERGVGQLKILHHPENGTYRFLLRREQVHKIVLNQLITTCLSVQPMTTSDKACMWAAYNYVEGQLNLEKLAVKFKYRETAEKFLEIVQFCLCALKEAQNDNLPCTIQN